MHFLTATFYIYMAIADWTHPQHCYYGYMYENAFRNENANASRYDACNQQAYNAFIKTIDTASRISDCRNAILELGKIDPLWAAYKTNSEKKKTYRWSILQKLAQTSPALCKRYFDFINQERSCNGIHTSLQNNLDIQGDDQDVLAYIILRSAYPLYSIGSEKKYHQLAQGLLSTYLTQLRLKNTQVNCYKSIKDKTIKDQGKYFLTALLENKRNKSNTKVYFKYILDPPITNIQTTCAPKKYPSRRVCFYDQLISHHNIDKENACNPIQKPKPYGLCMYDAMKTMASLVIDSTPTIISGYNSLDTIVRTISSKDKKNKKNICSKIKQHYRKIKDSNPYTLKNRYNKQRCQKISGIRNQEMTMRCIAGFSRQYANYNYAREIVTKLQCTK